MVAESTHRWIHHTDNPASYQQLERELWLGRNALSIHCSFSHGRLLSLPPSLLFLSSMAGLTRHVPPPPPSLSKLVYELLLMFLAFPLKRPWSPSELNVTCDCKLLRHVPDLSHLSLSLSLSRSSYPSSGHVRVLATRCCKLGRLPRGRVSCLIL